MCSLEDVIHLTLSFHETMRILTDLSFIFLYSYLLFLRNKYTVEAGYDDIGLYDIVYDVRYSVVPIISSLI